jgi:hypothetical protein
MMANMQATIVSADKATVEPFVILWVKVGQFQFSKIGLDPLYKGDKKKKKKKKKKPLTWSTL